MAEITPTLMTSTTPNTCPIIDSNIENHLYTEIIGNLIAGLLLTVIVYYILKWK